MAVTALTVLALVAVIVVARGGRGSAGTSPVGPATSTTAPGAVAGPTPSTDGPPASTGRQPGGPPGSFVDGRLLRGDGSPASGVPLAIYHPPGFDELLVVGFSLGLACIGPAVCFRDGLTGSTDAAGRFRIELPPEAGVGWRVAASLPDADGTGPGLPAEVEESFRSAAVGETVHAGDLRLWETVPSASTAKGITTVAFADAPPAGPSPDLKVTYTTPLPQEAGAEVWTASGRHARDGVDARILEDLVVQIRAESSTRPSVQGRKETEWRRTPALVTTTAGAGAPPTRGRPCTVVVDDRPEVLTPCPWTDGSLAAPAPRPGLVSSVTLDQGPGRHASFLVARACGCTVSTSPDGTTWTPVLTSTIGVSAGQVPAGPAARFVRAENPAAGFSELAAWT